MPGCCPGHRTYSPCCERTTDPRPFRGTNCTRMVSITAWDIRLRAGGHAPAHRTCRPPRSFSIGLRQPSRTDPPGLLRCAQVSQHCLSHPGAPRRHPEARDTGCRRCAVLQSSRWLHVVPGISLQLSNLHRSRRQQQLLGALPQQQEVPHSRRPTPSQQPMRRPWWPRGLCPFHHLPRQTLLQPLLGSLEPSGAPWVPS